VSWHRRIARCCLPYSLMGDVWTCYAKLSANAIGPILFSGNAGLDMGMLEAGVALVGAATGHLTANQRHRLLNRGPILLSIRADNIASFGIIETKRASSTAIANVEKRRKPITFCFVVIAPTRIVNSQLGVVPETSLLPWLCPCQPISAMAIGRIPNNVRPVRLNPAPIRL